MYVKRPLTREQQQLLRAARDASATVDDARDASNLAVQTALAAGLSLHDVAKALRVSVPTIARWRDSY